MVFLKDQYMKSMDVVISNSSAALCVWRSIKISVNTKIAQQPLSENNALSLINSSSNQQTDCLHYAPQI